MKDPLGTPRARLVFSATAGVEDLDERRRRRALAELLAEGVGPKAYEPIPRLPGTCPHCLAVGPHECGGGLP